MSHKKEAFVTAFALFSLFFGAGNLILPPLLGFHAGKLWWLVTFGFCLSAVVVPILGILAHAKLQGTIFDFGKKVSASFSLLYSVLVYAIAICLPSPRTAAVTHELAIAPLMGSSALTTSICYFVLVFIFVMNRSRILDIIGKILTPVIFIILVLVIGIAIGSYDFILGNIQFKNPFSDGILEGYQTFDAIGAVVVGGVIIISVNLKKTEASYEEKKTLILRAGLIAGLALLLIYAGLIITGALMHGEFDPSISRTALLSGIGAKTLGPSANIFLSLLVGLACFTTAVGIVTGTSDFSKHLFGNSQKAYVVTALLCCFLGILVGQFDVAYIIAVALPALMFIYPITIVLIILNVLPDKMATVKIFRAVVVTTIIFSVPDFLGSIGWGHLIAQWQPYIPLSQFSLGWVLPAVLAFFFMQISQRYGN
ncbi:MAG: branched-chain amino acid transport system II carrier protein [Flavobacteriales bacterium]|nr:MAG: branched-chain amino acid transport system II carrier protein [Flavobacteriales bacterium]